jgi:hypothetical protein
VRPCTARPVPHRTRSAARAVLGQGGRAATVHRQRGGTHATKCAACCRLYVAWGSWKLHGARCMVDLPFHRMLHDSMPRVTRAATSAAAGHVADVWVRPVLQWLRDSLHVALSWYMPHVPTGALVGAAEPPKPHSERTDGSALTLTTPSLHLRRLRNLLAAADGEQLAFQRRVCENAFTCRPRACKHRCARAREKTRRKNAEIRQPLARTHSRKCTQSVAIPSTCAASNACMAQHRTACVA